MTKYLLTAAAWAALSYPIYRFIAPWAVIVYGVVSLICLLIVGYLVYLTPTPSLLGVGVLLAEATAARALLFDPCLSLSQSWFNYREGRPAEPLFKVGTIALLDRALRWLAGELGMKPEHLRLVVWVASLLLTGLLIIQLST